MNNLLMICIASILPLAFVGGWLITRRDSGSHHAAWGKLAAQTGLSVSRDALESHRPCLSGTFHGREVRIGTLHIPYNLTTTHISVAVGNQMEARLRLVKQGIGIGWLRFVGIRDVVIGDPVFDRQFLIKSQPEAFAVSLFRRRDMLRNDLRKLPALWQCVELGGDWLSYTQYGIQRDVTKLHFLLDLLCNLAEAVEQEGNKLAVQP